MTLSRKSYPRIVEVESDARHAHSSPDPNRAGFEVVDDVGKSGMFGSPGQFLWGGAYYMTHWADPKAKIVAAPAANKPRARGTQ